MKHRIDFLPQEMMVGFFLSWKTGQGRSTNGLHARMQLTSFLIQLRRNPSLYNIRIFHILSFTVRWLPQWNIIMEAKMPYSYYEYYSLNNYRSRIPCDLLLFRLSLPHIFQQNFMDIFLLKTWIIDKDYRTFFSDAGYDDLSYR